MSASNLKDDIICAVAHFSFLCIILKIMMLNIFLTYRFALILSEVFAFHSMAFKFCAFNFTFDFFLSSSREVRGENTQHIYTYIHFRKLAFRNFIAKWLQKYIHTSKEIYWSTFVPRTPFSSYVGLLIRNHVPDEILHFYDKSFLSSILT